MIRTVQDLVRQSLYRRADRPHDPHRCYAVSAIAAPGEATGHRSYGSAGATGAGVDGVSIFPHRDAASTPRRRQSLQEARFTGDDRPYGTAIASADKLFKALSAGGRTGGRIPTTVAKLPARRHEAINQLQKINAVSPGNNALQNALAQLFASGRRDEDLRC